MSILPGTGIPNSPGTIAPTTVVVCGESPRDVFAAAESSLIGWNSESIVDGFREFHLRRYTEPKTGLSLNVFVGGLGSSSVELILQEGSLCGIQKFILTGSCATLNSGISCGDIVVPTSVILRPGALSEYFDFPSGAQVIEVTSPLQARLMEHLQNQKLLHHRTRHISTDAFYGIGASRDTEGNAQYGGSRLKGNRKPKGVALAIENPLRADTLDMEAAPFFCLGQEIEGIEVAALKVVSNPIPWSNDFDLNSIESAAKTAVRRAVDFARSIS